ncbi:MAG TPA: 2-oxoacid:acceptor oxidoreductase subunit alpha [Myxococcales bacterium]|jgi:2-oxoglutarate ferredoxin oxidoreductase subunit alpha
MKADPKGVATGAHYLDGDHACAEGAIAAGCRFSAGYPITPSTEVVEKLASRFPKVGGTFIQMEDELAASIAVLGGVWGGAKAITVTSGPGFSLMMEHIGLAAMTETPVVYIDVQRGGPSTGLPTAVGQADMMQARFGSHGDYRLIALCPNSPQESFDLTVLAFNLAEEYRTPVLVMLDECVGHMTEKVVIPPADQLEVTPRRFTKKKPGEGFKPFEPAPGSLVPEMTKAGDGHRIHVTGLTHDERGYPAMTIPAQHKLMTRLIGKIDDNADKICRWEEKQTDGADVVVVSYGITSRIAERSAELARAKGAKVGTLRLITAWPFPEKRVRELAGKIKAFVVPEINLGQMALEVERVAGGKCKTQLVGHSGGTVHDPHVIADAIMEVLR